MKRCYLYRNVAQSSCGLMIRPHRLWAPFRYKYHLFKSDSDTARSQHFQETKLRMDAIKGSADAIVYSLGTKYLLGCLPIWLSKWIINVMSDTCSMPVSNVPGPQHLLTVSGVPVDQLAFWPPQKSKIGKSLSVQQTRLCEYDLNDLPCTNCPPVINFYPIAFQAEGVLSLPVSIRLSVCLSVCPSVNFTFSAR